MVREARKEDLDALLKPYLFLHEDIIPELNAHLEKTWKSERTVPVDFFKKVLAKTCREV
ncbi:MAG: hypothetical protein K5847_02775 [Lachnospiraceae bacterium]|nr:hypothetical protein [Lachnospiraceae bacterium]